MKTLKQFIHDHKLTFTCEWADTNPNMDSDEKWMQGASHWKCLLKAGKRQMTVYFSQGSAHTKEPTIEDVLDCIASDAAGYENARSFEDWASEYGYDTDSRKAERTYKTIEKQVDSLARLLKSSDAYDQLLFHTERM